MLSVRIENLQLTPRTTKNNRPEPLRALGGRPSRFLHLDYDRTNNKLVVSGAVGTWW